MLSLVSFYFFKVTARTFEINVFHVVVLLSSSDLGTQTSEHVFAGNVIGGPLRGAVKVLGVSLAPKFWINFWEAHDVLRGTHR